MCKYHAINTDLTDFPDNEYESMSLEDILPSMAGTTMQYRVLICAPYCCYNFEMFSRHFSRGFNLDEDDLPFDFQPLSNEWWCEELKLHVKKYKAGRHSPILSKWYVAPAFSHLPFRNLAARSLEPYQAAK
jgi:hypothetical protein